MSIQPESIELAPAANLQYRQDLSKLIPAAGDEPLFLIFQFSLAVTQTTTFYCEGGIPDYWAITTMPNTGVRLNIWQGQASGFPIMLGGGGQVRLPATSEFLNLSSVAGTCVGNVFAVRKHPEFEIETGSLDSGGVGGTIIQGPLSIQTATNAGEMFVYAGAVDPANYERLEIGFVGSAPGIRFGALGSGNPGRAVRINGGGSVIIGDSGQDRFSVTGGGILFSLDNTLDIGASGANRPKNVYVAGFLQASSFIQTGTYSFTSNNMGLRGGTGVPPTNPGADGDIYFRSDGGAGTTIYQRRAGAWVGIV